MKVRILRNLGTGLPPFKEGEEHDLPDDQANDLMTKGLAESASTLRTVAGPLQFTSNIDQAERQELDAKLTEQRQAQANKPASAGGTPQQPPQPQQPQPPQQPKPTPAPHPEPATPAPHPETPRRGRPSSGT